MEQNKRRLTRQERRTRLAINVLTLIVLALIVFEGKSLISLFSKQSVQEMILDEEAEVFASANIQSLAETESETEDVTEDTTATQPETVQTEPSPAQNTSSAAIGLPEGGDAYASVVVPAQATPIDESYFEDAVFIGDSRMEGFRNLSGITKGSFVTAVGMQLENFYTDAQIPTAKGNVLVMDALKNLNYSKIYMMIGTNELGAWDMSQVKESYRKVLADIKTAAATTDPTVYIYSVVYVEEALTDSDYVNNTNVDTVNLEILKMCQEEGYHYINLNEVLSDGNHSLISGASSDGVHLNAKYCEDWLSYTKLHYLPVV
ncbi:MAG: GDSL-type esterase/lipase family protein [Eubacteriales bacterium]|nr:GDSL-type esterase/lipase family protein [Eubacteriales bacterium]